MHYNLSIVGKKPIFLDCHLSTTNVVAEKFMLHMGHAKPIFGYACREAEIKAKNLVKLKIGVNSIESWVGRDTIRYIPGLYWITMMSSQLLFDHDIPLSAMEAMAQQHIDIEGSTHLFRFYSTPDEWLTPEGQIAIRAPFPTIFDIKKIRAQTIGLRSVQEWVKISHDWS